MSTGVFGTLHDASPFIRNFFNSFRKAELLLFD
jgi:hypothetical protein